MTSPEGEVPRPVLRVVRGSPTEEELGAVVSVVLAAAAAGAAAAQAHARLVESQSRSQWAARERLVRRPVQAGPGAWRASAWPR